MSRFARRLLTLVVFSILVAPMLPALAAPAEVVAQGEDSGPAIVINPPEDQKPAPAWTYRFLIPTTLVLVVLVVVVTVVQYFVKVVRKRYRAVQ
jgi:phosphatidylglycerophosphate synthase